MQTHPRAASGPLLLRQESLSAPAARLRATLLFSVGILAAMTATADPAPLPTFPEASYRKHIEVLSSDAFEGRAPGTEGEKKTLAYIEQQFRAAGLQPGIGNSFLQPVPMVEITPHADAAMQLAGAGGKSLALTQSG